MALADEELEAASHRCTDCGRTGNNPDDFLAVKVSFLRLGPRSGQVVKSRTVRHLCDRCVRKDPIWNMPSRIQTLT